jgi:DnaJ-domain-containing protein 1
MGIWSRLGDVINSYLNDFGEQTSERFNTHGSPRSGDPDFDAAYEELDDYLNRKETRGGHSRDEPKANASGAGAKFPPEELRADFEILGVPFGADAETCKAAYKKLLKIHHPDRHAGHESNFKKATERSAKINAAWDRIEKWRSDGNRA